MRKVSIVVRIWICGLGFGFDGLVSVLVVQLETGFAVRVTATAFRVGDSEGGRGLPLVADCTDLREVAHLGRAREQEFHIFVVRIW